MHARRGAIIIYCVALAALAVVIGFTFLRATTKDLEAGDSGHQYVLAQEAARAGVEHALECLGTDFSSTALTVGANAGGSVGISAPPTFLDGPWRAPFIAFTAPNLITGGDYGPDDDLHAENVAVSSLLESTGSNQGVWGRMYQENGDMVDPARGRWHEVGYTNIGTWNPTGGSPQGVAPIHFTDIAAPIPDRSAGLFLDRNFTRLNSGSKTNDRLSARYRLRYAVSVEDLQGHLLMNPVADMDTDWHHVNAGYRGLPVALANAQNGWYNMAAAFATGSPVSALRWEHVFLGRGNTSNCDRYPAGYPTTFPMMFRRVDPGNPQNPPWWGFFNLDTSYRCPFEAASLYPATAAPAASGGDPMPDGVQGWPPVIMHAWTGPQFSWVNAYYAGRGFMDKWLDDSTNYGWTLGYLADAAALPTPFGHPLASSPPGGWTWYQGRVDTPWRVNLLTAPARAISCMLIAYLPPAVKKLKLTQETFYPCTGTDLNGSPTYGPASGSASFSPEVDESVPGRDLFTSLAGPAFADYPPPSAGAITPDFQVPDTRTSDARYPGKLWNDNDDFGASINVDTALPIGRCSHTTQPFLYNVSASQTHLQREGIAPKTPPPPGWGANPNDKFIWSLDPSVYRYANSYWWDIITAFTSAVAVVRAEWVQFPTPVMNPATAFIPAGKRDPSQYTSIQALDALFLRQLGEDFANPGSSLQPKPGVMQRWNASVMNQQFVDGGFTANNTIKMVLQGTSGSDPNALFKSRLMERVLNDFRLSFMGADPSYSETFRPLDFNGDGIVDCSCYPAVGGTDHANGLDHFMPVDAGAGAPGRGPMPPTWFSLSGCFFIGKSRFYRVISRGEVYDNTIALPVADATIEQVVVLDPAGDGDLGKTQTLLQRWHYNRVNSHLPRHKD